MKAKIKSGLKFVRIPEGLHKLVKANAGLLGITIEQYIARILSDNLK